MVDIMIYYLYYIVIIIYYYKNIPQTLDIQISTSVFGLSVPSKIFFILFPTRLSPIHFSGFIFSISLTAPQGHVASTGLSSGVISGLADLPHPLTCMRAGSLTALSTSWAYESYLFTVVYPASSPWPCLELVFENSFQININYLLPLSTAQIHSRGNKAALLTD